MLFLLCSCGPLLLVKSHRPQGTSHRLRARIYPIQVSQIQRFRVRLEWPGRAQKQVPVRPALMRKIQRPDVFPRYRNSAIRQRASAKRQVPLAIGLRRVRPAIKNRRWILCIKQAAGSFFPFPRTFCRAQLSGCRPRKTADRQGRQAPNPAGGHLFCILTLSRTGRANRQPLSWLMTAFVRFAVSRRFPASFFFAAKTNPPHGFARRRIFFMDFVRIGPASLTPPQPCFYLRFAAAIVPAPASASTATTAQSIGICASPVCGEAVASPDVSAAAGTCAASVMI